jgi:hypothetical protein
MKISERTISRLSEIISGQNQLSQYRSGPDLVRFFNEFGRNDIYGSGFPSRVGYTEGCIRDFNETPILKEIILSALDPRDYMDQELFDNKTKDHKLLEVSIAVRYVNDFLLFDGYEIVPKGNTFYIKDNKVGEIIFEHELDCEKVSHSFISEQIDKCRTKIGVEDFDGAITNARSLVEGVLTFIEKECDAKCPEYDGDLQKLYKRVQKHLNLSPDQPEIDDTLKQTLRGFISIIIGLAGLSNKMGDRHVRKYKPSKHHATLIVNSAMTFCNFIFDTYAYQK